MALPINSKRPSCLILRPVFFPSGLPKIIRNIDVRLEFLWGNRISRMSKRVALLLLLVMPALFQNCAKTTFTNVEGALHLSESSSSNTDGNGTGYGGKLTGEFYRFTPDFTCEGKESPVSRIAATDSDITLTENKQLKCGATQTSLTANLVDRSVFQNDIVGYLEGIFESEKAAPTSIPANLVEVWCRDTADRSGIETVTHYDRESQLAVTRIYAAGPASSIMTIPDFNVSRVISSTQVTMKDGKDFSLIVYRNRPASQLGLFQGSLETVINGQKIARETSCRLGGSLDAKVWPSRQVVDLNISSIKFSPDRQAYGYTSSNASTSPVLYEGEMQSGRQQKVTSSALSKGVLDFDFTPDSRSFVYWADQRVAGIAELFHSRLDGTNSSQLNALLTDERQASEYKLQFSADGSRVIYQDGHQATFVDNEMSLNSVPLSGGTPITLSPPSSGSDDSVHDFAVSKKSNKVAFLTGVGFNLKVYLSNLDGSQLTQIKIPYPAGQWSIPYGSTFSLPEPGNFLFVQSMRLDGNLDFLSTAIAMDGSAIISLPINWGSQFTDSSGNLALIADQKVANSYKIMDLKTGHLLPLPAMQPLSFSKDGSHLIGTEVGAGGQAQNISISIVDGQKTVICPQASTAVSKLQELGGDQWLLTAWDSGQGILNVYSQSNGQCQLKNSLPLTKPKLKDVYLSPDGQKIVVSVSVNIQDIDQDQLLFIPLNGKPARQINSPIYFGAHIGNVEILPDSNSIFYTGDQLNPSETGAFVWKAPLD